MMKIFHLLQMQFQNTLFEQIGSYRSYQMYLKDSEECLQNPPNKKKNPKTTHRQCQAQLHPLQIDFVHL